MAPSPKSSPKATWIWSAARTNPRMLSLPWIPSLPASRARSSSCSRLVRVSIFISSSSRPSTSSWSKPVVFITSLYTSSSFAASSAALRKAIDRPVMAAMPAVTMPKYLLKPSARPFSDSVARFSSVTTALNEASSDLILELTCCSCFDLSMNCCVPGTSCPSCFLSCDAADFNSLRLLELRVFIMSEKSFISFFATLNCLRSWLAFFDILSPRALSPAL